MIAHYKASELRRQGGGPLRSRKISKKSPQLCKDGPMVGETLWFGDTTLTSAIFTYRGETGRYIGGHLNAA